MLLLNSSRFTGQYKILPVQRHLQKNAGDVRFFTKAEVYQLVITVKPVQLQTEQQNAVQQIQKYAVSLNYFEGQGLKNADLIISTASKQFVGGEIDYLQWVILVDQAINIRNEYLESLYNYNLAVIQAQKLNNL